MQSSARLSAVETMGKPNPTTRVGRFLPPSYVFMGVRAIVHGGTFSTSTLLLGIALSFVYILIAFGLFAMVYRSAIRSGLIARYSAESLS